MSEHEASNSGVHTLTRARQLRDQLTPADLAVLREGARNEFMFGAVLGIGFGIGTMVALRKTLPAMSVKNVRLISVFAAGPFGYAFGAAQVNGQTRQKLARLDTPLGRSLRSGIHNSTFQAPVSTQETGLVADDGFHDEEPFDNEGRTQYEAPAVPSEESMAERRERNRRVHAYQQMHQYKADMERVGGQFTPSGGPLPPPSANNAPHQSTNKYGDDGFE